MIDHQYPLADDDDVAARRTRRAVSIVLPRGPRRLGFSAAMAIVLLGVALAGLVLARGTGYVYDAPSSHVAAPPIEIPSDVAEARRLQTKLSSENRHLTASLARMAPSGTYIVVDQTQNRLYLMNGPDIARAAVCSAGSGMVLKSWGGKHKWVFDTPRGLFKVRNRISNPIWRKPDWEFVQEGKPVPKNPADRFEAGTLGKYALYLEDGYMIHGTLYTRLLGRSVTHGCIRLGPDDLQAVWNAAPLGTPVYIF
jgi:lipoprotein-anchoring transpeptidase ErfK/SrfK